MHIQICVIDGCFDGHSKIKFYFMMTNQIKFMFQFLSLSLFLNQVFLCYNSSILISINNIKSDPRWRNIKKHSPSSSKEMKFINSIIYH